MDHSPQLEQVLPEYITVQFSDSTSSMVVRCSYEYLRTLFSDLRGQLLHLTGKDPLVEDHPYYNEPIKNVSPIPGESEAV